MDDIVQRNNDCPDNAYRTGSSHAGKQVKKSPSLSLTACCLSALASSFQSWNTEMDARQLPESMTLDSVGSVFVPHCSTSCVNGSTLTFTRERTKEKSETCVQVVPSDLGKLTFCTCARNVKLEGRESR